MKKLLALVAVAVFGGTAAACDSRSSSSRFRPASAVPLYSDVAPVRSPDGKLVAFASNRTGHTEVYVMRPDGTGVEPLTSLEATTYASSWTPDGRSLLVESDVSGDVEIYALTLDGEMTRLTHTTGRDSHPHGSPSGDRIYFYAVRDGNGDIYAMGPDGDDVTRITDEAGADLTPVPSPDGSRLAFGSDRSGDREIHILSLRDGGVTRLTRHDGFDGWPRWSPDGTRLTFTRDIGDGNNEVFVIDADGSGERRITDAPGNDYQSDWLDDGRLIARSDRDGRPGLYVLSLADLSAKKLTNTELGEFAAMAWREGPEAARDALSDPELAMSEPAFFPSEIRNFALSYIDSRPELTAELLELATRVHPESISLWIALGDASLAAGLKERSVGAFEHALTLTDGNPSMTLARLRQAQAD